MLVPRYGSASLADVLPSLLAGFEVVGETDRLGVNLAGVRRVCVLLVDGLGAELLAAHPGEAPFLTGLQGQVLTVGFPSTTATSLASLGTGMPPGEHGLLGYLLDLPGLIEPGGPDRAVNMLQWKLHGAGPRIDLLRELPPEQWQPRPTAFERAAAAGITVTRLGPGYQGSSGLTRAVLRGGEFRATYSIGDLAACAVSALAADRSLVYAYFGELDLTGHLRGPSAPSWALELGHVDRLAQEIADRLPPDAALVVTGDHGMVQITEKVDLDRSPALQQGVRLIGGEPRARYAYADAGAAADVLHAWRDVLCDGFAVLSRDEAVQAGWFGPTVAPQVRSRIGDVIAIARGGQALIRSGAEPLQSQLLGHHGSLTSAELLVPLLTARSTAG